MSKEQTIYFEADQYRLTGTLHLPSNPRPPVIIGCHGLMADRHSPKQISLANACNHAGLAYFRFDHRGCGDSQGDFEKVTSLEARCTDLRCAMGVLDRMDVLGPLLGLFGSSFGGTTVLQMASEQAVPKLVTYAAPVNSRSIQSSTVGLEGVQAKQLQQALDFDIVDRLGSIADILVVHGGNDEIVPTEHARIIYQRAKEPKALIIQPGGDHRMSAPTHQQSFAEQFIDWFGKYDE